MNKKQKGFSLIELLIVVAIILIIAAIAIPNLLRSKMAANQASAVGSVRTINTAAITYNSTYGNGYPSSLTMIGNNGSTSVGCDNAELVDSVLTSGTKSGYTFILTGGGTQLNSSTSACTAGPFGYQGGYVITAVPATLGTTGQTSYCSDGTGVIRQNPAGTINAGTGGSCVTTDTPLGN
jgi:prepilin-type N-terminal cleavage/methylation domain-containing protein